MTPLPLTGILRCTVGVIACALAGCASPDARGAASRDTTVVQLILPESVRIARADSLERLRADSIRTVRLDSINRAIPGYVVDSARSIDEELRRFRKGLTEPTELSGGATSRDALVQSIVAAVVKQREATLAGLAVTRAEFAWLVYPETPYTHPPLQQAPGLTWMLITRGSDLGRRRLLDHFAREPLGYVDYRCADAPGEQGANRLWTNCRVRRVRAGGDTIEQRLFGTILERTGRFKLLSYRNDF